MQKGRKGPGGDGEKNAAVFDNKNRDAPEAPSEQREAQNSLVLPRAAVTLEARTRFSAEAGAAHPAAVPRSLPRGAGSSPSPAGAPVALRVRRALQGWVKV